MLYNTSLVYIVLCKCTACYINFDLFRCTDIAPVAGCSARTLRRRALELELQQPGVAPFTRELAEDGTISIIHHLQPRPEQTLSDDELDAFVSSILQNFPNFGRAMIRGRLAAAGHDVTRDRIAASYARMHGTRGRFGDRTIHRKVYNVPGANSLWHHDGQHG